MTTEPLLFVLQGETVGKRRPQMKKGEWLGQKHSYRTHPLSHHAFWTNLMASTSALEIVQKRIKSVGNRIKLPGVKLLLDHLIR